jgi:hypothetical protein
MITISTIKDFIIQEGYRILKVIQYGAKTADECSPFGDDGNPLPEMNAIFCETEVGGEPVIIGYIQKERLSDPGEKRIYSLDQSGKMANDIWLKNDGTIEVGGNTDNFVSYRDLNLALLAQNQKINEELLKIAAAVTPLGAAYTPAPITLDISAAKTEKIKCIR